LKTALRFQVMSVDVKSVTPRLVPFGEELWVADGPVCSFYSFPYPTRMAVIRLANGDLFVWSPVRLDAALRAEVEALGRVAHLVEPNSLHHLFLPDWVEAYPAARVYAPPGLRKKRRDIRFDTELGAEPEPGWAGQIEQIVLAGSVALTELLFFHHGSRTALVCDSIQSFPHGWFKGWRGVLARLDGIAEPNIGAPREWRLSFLNRKAARAAVERLLALAPERVVLAHGEMVAVNGADLVRRGFAWLLRGKAHTLH
jgi:hypothetical protein